MVWDFARRERIKTLTDHTGIVNTVAFSSDGKWFATGSDDHTVIIWDAARLEKATVLHGHSGPVGCVSFSSFGHLLASTSGEPAVTILWDTDSWQKVRELPEGYVYGNHIFLENNRRLVDHYGQMWNLQTGEKLNDINEDWLGSWVEISPNGKLWAAVDSTGKVKLVDLEQHKLLGSRSVHHDHGRSVAFSPDGRWLATAAERVVLWDATKFEKIVPLEYESIVWSVTFSPDGKWLVSTHGDGAILVWDVAERELVANLREHSGGVRGVALSNDGKQLASASEDKSVILWDTASNHKRSVLAGHRTRVAAVAFSSDGRWLASTDQVGNIIRWDLEQRSAVMKITSPRGFSSYCVAISPNGHAVATSFAVYDFDTGQPILKENETLWRQVYGAVFSRDGRVLIGVNDRGDIILVDTATWQFTARQEAPDLKLVAVALSPDGRYLVTGEDSKTVRLWTVNPLRQVAVIGRHEARIKAVAFAPDGKQVASAGDDKMIALWDVDSRKLITRIGTHTSPIYSIAFSPDGRRLISGEHDRSVRIYTRHRELWGFPLKW